MFELSVTMSNSSINIINISCCHHQHHVLSSSSAVIIIHIICHHHQHYLLSSSSSAANIINSICCHHHQHYMMSSSSASLYVMKTYSSSPVNDCRYVSRYLNTSTWAGCHKPSLNEWLSLRFDLD